MARTRATSNRKATEPEDDLTAQQAQIRRLVGRAREEAHEREEKKGKRASVAWPPQSQTVHIYMQTIQIEQVRYEQKM
jgi:hypothetical protein